MPTLSRADNSLLGRWWWSVDRWTLGAIGTLIGFGYIMMLAASPAVAERIGTSRETLHPEAGRVPGVCRGDRGPGLDDVAEGHQAPGDGGLRGCPGG